MGKPTNMTKNGEDSVGKPTKMTQRTDTTQCGEANKYDKERRRHSVGKPTQMTKNGEDTVWGSQQI